MSVATARVIPSDFKQEPGSELYQGVYLGQLLGAGSQAKVYTLVDKEGKPLNKVLKIGHTDIGHTMILNKFAASMMDLQHEWELGVHIMAVLRDEKGYLPGYTSTFDSCVSKQHNGKIVFRGMILEQINGYPVRKRLQDPTFHNIKYVREMLFQLLTALDRGQRLLGFTHADMGLGNIMEHYPEVYPEGTVTSVSDIPGFEASGSGSLLPKGPKMEFKIIDYGLVESLLQSHFSLVDQVDEESLLALAGETGVLRVFEAVEGREEFVLVVDRGVFQLGEVAEQERVFLQVERV